MCFGRDIEMTVKFESGKVNIAIEKSEDFISAIQAYISFAEHGLDELVPQYIVAEVSTTRLFCIFESDKYRAYLQSFKPNGVFDIEGFNALVQGYSLFNKLSSECCCSNDDVQVYARAKVPEGTEIELLDFDSNNYLECYECCDIETVVPNGIEMFNQTVYGGLPCDEYGVKYADMSALEQKMLLALGRHNRVCYSATQSGVMFVIAESDLQKIENYCNKFRDIHWEDNIKSR